MKQRLSIASALLCDPDVMILDEPTNGLDPQGIAAIRELIIDIANGGKTIVLASHLLDEVQKVCTDFSVLKQGKLIYSGKVADVAKGSTSIEVIAEEPIEEILNNSGFVESIKKEKDKLILKLSEGKEARDVNKLLIENGVVVSHLNTIHKSLEKQFLEVLKESA